MLVLSFFVAVSLVAHRKVEMHVSHTKLFFSFMDEEWKDESNMVKKGRP